MAAPSAQVKRDTQTFPAAAGWYKTGGGFVGIVAYDSTFLLTIEPVTRRRARM